MLHGSTEGSNWFMPIASPRITRHESVYDSSRSGGELERHG